MDETKQSQCLQVTMHETKQNNTITTHTMLKTIQNNTVNNMKMFETISNNRTTIASIAHNAQNNSKQYNHQYKQCLK